MLRYHSFGDAYQRWLGDNNSLFLKGFQYCKAHIAGHEHAVENIGNRGLDVEIQ